jgi:AP2 domain/HNH endonuclease
MTNRWPVELDHVNGSRSDNRWCNLREATHSQNRANAQMRTDNTSGFKGVTWLKQTGKWRARIEVNGKRIHLGEYDTRERAFIAYIFAQWKYHGDFANPDADYIRAVKERKARKELETRILWNLANPNPNYMAA